MAPGQRREAGAGVKLRLLMWKNFLLQWRSPKQTIAEVLVPVLAMSLILIVRSEIEPYVEPQVNYPPFPAGTLNYSRTVILGMNVSRLSVAYSPESPLLAGVVRGAVTNMLRSNMDWLLPALAELAPGLAALLPPAGAADSAQVDAALALLVPVRGYSAAADLAALYADEAVTREVIAAVEFPDEFAALSSLPSNLSYALRFPERPRLNSLFRRGGRSWRSALLFPAFPTPGPRFPYSYEGGNDPGYVNEMFIALQHYVSSELIRNLTGADPGVAVSVRRYPHPPFTNDAAVTALQMLFPMLIVLSFSYTAINLVRDITLEKELQLKEAMKIMGLPTWLHWTAWFIKQFLFLMIVAVLIVILLKTSWFTTASGLRDYAVFTNTPWSVLLFFTALYFAAIIFCCFMVSSFFSNASTAALFMGVSWFMMYIPAFFLTLDVSVPRPLQALACLSLNSAVAFGYQLLLGAESTGGLQWGSFFASPASVADRLLFGHVVVLILLDCVLYLLVALYCEQVWPGAHGTPRVWYFPVQRSFWCEGTDEDVADDEEADYENVTKEADPIGLPVGVKISNLSKVYGNNVAVDKLSLDIYLGQITVLLGHNGAGKSTTVSMLCGTVPPTGGSVLVGGVDVRRRPRAARARLAVCPQHNVLFPALTVAEHLLFFSRLKGFTGKKLHRDIDVLIEKLELQDKRDCLAGALSGGQQRRLSVGVALGGGARVVLLDEPTSGMDPASRRALWDLLQKEKTDRAIILTTHFMDEADYLGDRIAIMSGGRLRCAGSPYFLKSHYGIGYTLVVVKDELFDAAACGDVIRKHLGSDCFKEDKGTEVTYSLSNEHSHAFEALLGDLEDHRPTIRFKNYGLQATTMEDVFMTVGSENNDNDFDSESDTGTTDTCSVKDVDNNMDCLELLPTVSGWRLAWQRAAASWVKLWLCLWRSRARAALQVLVPVLLMTASLEVLRMMLAMNEGIQRRELTLNQGFTKTETFLRYEGAPGEAAGASAGARAAEAYAQFFNDDDRLLLAVDRPVDQYYLDRGSDIYEMSSMRETVLIGATFEPEAATAWFSNFGYHDVATSLATLHAALLRAAAPGAELRVANHPLMANYADTRDTQMVVSLMSMQFSNGLGYSVSLLSAVFIMFYIKERVSSAKLLQQVAGLSPAAQWLSAAVFDWLWFMALAVLLLLITWAYRVTGFSEPVELGRLYLCLGVYALALLPLTYALAALVPGAAFGFVVMVFANALVGMMGAQIAQALFALEQTTAATVLDYTLQFFPMFSLITSVRNIHEHSLRVWTCLQACDLAAIGLPSAAQCDLRYVCENYTAACCLPEDPYFRWASPGVLRYLVSTLAAAAAAWTALFVIEYRLLTRLFHRRRAPPARAPAALEDDVRREAARAAAAGPADQPLLVRGLTKYYGTHLAVNQVSFRVESGEVFGLLGVNGAGKTSTFRMLLGELLASAGDAFVCGHSVRTDVRRVHANIGYCPQFDAVFPELTGRENLRLFAALRGLRAGPAAAAAAALARQLGFHQHLDKEVHKYSGGNRRKLSTAVALLGSARAVFLDEPTTGVDPRARRRVWRAVDRARRARAVLLTSHSMEECEALCSRLTIMVNGECQCLASPQRLKDKYSQGFTLTIKLRLNEGSPQELTEAVKSYVASNFTDPKLMEQYQGLLTYYLPARGASWARVFGVLERARAALPVEDYSVQQTTLEQVFLQFTKYQREAVKGQ